MNERCVDAVSYLCQETAVHEVGKAEKGLGDARAVDFFKRMAVEGRDMAGVMVLVHLCGVTKDEAILMNEPEGGFCGP